MSVCSVGLIIQRNVNNFSHLSVVFRTAVVDRLLANGSSRSWLLGNVLVTVTVSKRTPSNMPCAYCSSGKAFLSESLPRVRSSSSSQLGLEPSLQTHLIIHLLKAKAYPIPDTRYGLSK